MVGNINNGIYEINENGNIIEVYCDMTTDGGGWTVFQRRINGKQDFDLTWDEYRRGFGNKSAEFWMGLDKLHSLTRQGSYELRIELKDCQNKTLYAKYGTFKVMNLSENFRLQIAEFSACPGFDDSLSYHNGMLFSTKDRDNDLLHSQSCSSVYHSGWWYKTCHRANLNGQYRPCVVTADAMTWHNNSIAVGLRFTEMKFRPL
uniref:fibrinogen C domain-containing protein 1-like n=1 Tax=Ciona intestinalis TaxID=7719 RepID=UPI000180C858|nr:fibrinogen C domain-containing protein 1-like [Ciona intestinalis]XP_026691744.1 fibrinogen C domain-containing protein 1-like [Ciona intestinalis]|eukprot:XP_002125040.1 fibrinogen C domain-containing protein 1-like [Ciona intestinalis]